MPEEASDAAWEQGITLDTSPEYGFAESALLNI